MPTSLPTLLLAVAPLLTQAPATPDSVTLPAGTRLLTQLQRTFHSRSARPGDTLYLQTTFPLSLGDHVLIPAGTHVVATVDSLAAHGATDRTLELRLHVARLIFANGYLAGVSIPARARSRESDGLRIEVRNKPGALAASILAPLAGIAIGAASGGGEGATVGGGVGSAVGGVAMVAALAHGADLIMDAGLPADLVLQDALTLDGRRAMAPAPPSAYAQSTFPHRKPRERLCYDPGTPGTPDIVIPGTPGTPAIGDSPGTPGMPDVTIPGQPAMPDSWYPCR